MSLHQSLLFKCQILLKGLVLIILGEIVAVRYWCILYNRNFLYSFSLPPDSWVFRQGNGDSKRLSDLLMVEPSWKSDLILKSVHFLLYPLLSHLISNFLNGMEAGVFCSEDSVYHHVVHILGLAPNLLLSFKNFKTWEISLPSDLPGLLPFARWFLFLCCT